VTSTADTLSVVICAYTEARWADLSAAIESVRTQERPAHEIVLVIDHNDRPWWAEYHTGYIGTIDPVTHEIKRYPIKSQPANVQRGALLFSQRCSGCHTLDVVGAQGTTLNVRQREHTDGPNFNVRREQVPNILYAIRNGGFSGAIMPQNVVVGQDANDVAAFLSKYSGLQASENSSATAGQQQSEQ